MSKIVILKSGEPAHLSPLHSGFAHGFGIFETIRLAGGQLEFWESHYKRLLHSAKVFDLHFGATEADVLKAIRELVQSEKLSDAAVKLSLLDAGAKVCCYVYSRTIEQPDNAVSLCLDTQSSQNERSVLAGHKTHNYMEFMCLKQSAKKAGFFDVVRVNTAGFVTETAMANLFFLRENTVYTPAVSTGILPGVIRTEVLQAARACSIPIEEGHYPAEFLQTATAVFLTYSTVGILPVSSLVANDTSVTYRQAHPIVEMLKTALDDARERRSIQLINEPII